MDEFLAMGGYGRYLAVAYGVTALVLVGNLVAARRRFRRTQERLRDQLARQDRRRPPAGLDSANDPTSAGRGV